MRALSNYVPLYGLAGTEEAYSDALEDYLANPNEQTYAAAYSAYEQDLAQWEADKKNYAAANTKQRVEYEDAMRLYRVAWKKYEEDFAVWKKRMAYYNKTLVDWQKWQDRVDSYQEAYNHYINVELPTYAKAVDEWYDKSYKHQQWVEYRQEHWRVSSTRTAIFSGYASARRKMEQRWSWAPKLPVGSCISAQIKAQAVSLCESTTRGAYVAGLGGEIQGPDGTFYGTNEYGVPYCAIAELATCQAVPPLPEPPSFSDPGWPGPKPTAPTSPMPPPASQRPPEPADQPPVEPTAPVKPKAPEKIELDREKPTPPPSLEKVQAAAGGMSAAGLLLLALAAGGAYVVYKRGKKKSPKK